MKLLFGPLGIDSIDWTVITKPKRFNNGGAGLKISPHAMFALGNLMLNNGKKGQLQIVPETWVSKCKTTQNNTNNEIMYAEDYGYLWWVGQAHGHELYYANGYGGQFVICVPDFDLVMVSSCTWQGYSGDQSEQNWYNIYTTLMDEILTAVNN